MFNSLLKKKFAIKLAELLTDFFDENEKIEAMTVNCQGIRDCARKARAYNLEHGDIFSIWHSPTHIGFTSVTGNKIFQVSYQDAWINIDPNDEEGVRLFHPIILNNGTNTTALIEAINKKEV